MVPAVSLIYISIHLLIYLSIKDPTSAEETEEEIITKSSTASRPNVHRSINQPPSPRGRRRKPVSGSAAASKKSSAASSTTEIPSSGYTSSNYNEVN